MGLGVNLDAAGRAQGLLLTLLSGITPGGTPGPCMGPYLCIAQNSRMQGTTLFFPLGLNVEYCWGVTVWPAPSKLPQNNSIFPSTTVSTSVR